MPSIGWSACVKSAPWHTANMPSGSERRTHRPFTSSWDCTWTFSLLTELFFCKKFRKATRVKRLHLMILVLIAVTRPEWPKIYLSARFSSVAQVDVTLETWRQVKNFLQSSFKVTLRPIVETLNPQKSHPVTGFHGSADVPVYLYINKLQAISRGNLKANYTQVTISCHQV